MEVLRGNFKEVLPQVSASIKKADFLVIDAEFTGLIIGKDVSMFDAPSEYYKTLLYGSTEFLVIQYGLCAFYWDEERKHYMNDAYNFYLFPRYNYKPEKVFLCQSSSLQFLISQGFDLNKTIRDGVSYMPLSMETKVREKLIEKSASKETVTVPEENKAFVEETCKKVRTFLDEEKANEIDIDRCNSFIRMLLHQELRNTFKNEIFIDTVKVDNANRFLKVIRASSVAPENRHQYIKNKKEWDDLEESVGFSKVARMISDSGKLVIGHNMFLDVVHSLNSFFQPLPDNYDEFKEFAHCMFPNFLDTKYMSYLPPFKDKVNSSVLNHLLGTLAEAPFSIPKVGSIQGRGYLKAEDKHHEAGYDAYITGLCFLSMHDHLTRMRNEPNARVSLTSPVLKPFLNKLFLAKTAHQDSPCINLTGVDPIVTREHVFLLNFPKEWTRNDINNLFTPFGGVVCQFLNDTQAIVGLHRREEKVRVRELNRNKRISLVPYDRYKKSTEICLVPKPPRAPKEGEAVQRTGTITTPNNEDNVEDKWNKYSKRSLSKHIDDDHLSDVEADQSNYAEADMSNDAEAEQSNCAEAGPSTYIEASPYRVPESVPRVRSKSLRQRSPSAVAPTRKRTSSGVFEVDSNDPPPKKPELTRAESKAQTPITKRRRKDTKKNKEVTEKGKGKKDKKNSEVKELKIVDKFDSKAKSKCVSAFKESDSWD